MLTTVLVVVHVLVALAIIGLGSLFGATGSANFLSRTTAVLAALFFILSLALAYTATRRPAEEGGGVIDVIRNQQQQQQQVPAPSQKPAADVPKPEAQPPSAAPAQTPSDKQVPQ